MICCRGVVHRDLKLENLILATEDDITHVKIADFGLAKRAQTGEAMRTVCGTPQVGMAVFTMRCKTACIVPVCTTDG